MYYIINPHHLEIYLALSKASGMQLRGSACSYLDTEKGLKSGWFFKQLPLNMDGQAANAWIIDILSVLTCSTQFKPISLYPPPLTYTISTSLYLIRIHHKTPNSFMADVTPSTPCQQVLQGLHHGGLTHYSALISVRQQQFNEASAWG